MEGCLSRYAPTAVPPFVAYSPPRTGQRAICETGHPSDQNRERKPVHPGQWLKVLPIAQNHLLNHRATSTGCNKERGRAGSGQGESWRTRDDCVVVHFF